MMEPHEIIPILVQPQVRAYAESLGEFGRLWLDSLPAVVELQCQEWGLQRGEALSSGSRSYVCRVTTADGQRAVLKVALPEAILERQIATLVAAQGRGYVQVLAHDIQRGALLLESLGSSAEESLSNAPAVLSVTAEALRQAWQAPLELCPPLQDESEHKAAGLFALVEQLTTVRIAQGFQAVIDQALRYARQRLKVCSPARQVVVHGDPHAANLLRVEHVHLGAESGYVFVDPEGFRCEPEYDLGVAVRAWNPQLLAASNPQAEVRAWCKQLAHDTGTDAEAIWQWAFLERVSSGLYLAHHGMPQLGALFLAVAHRLLGEICNQMEVINDMTALDGWANFYVIVGSSAGALIGLQFVVMTLIADLPSTANAAQAGDAFASPSVVHFCVVLLLAALVSAPWNEIVTIAMLWGCVGLAGLVYTVIVARRLRVQTTYQPVFEDWLFHVLLPFVAYTVLAISAYLAYAHARPALFLVGAAALLLLFIGIHNTWDAVTYHVFVRRREQRETKRQR